jgi:hypothetical protein
MGRTRSQNRSRPTVEPRLKSFVRIAALAAVGGALMVSAAMAQPQGGYGQQPDLHALLHIRPDQEAPWKAFQGASQPQPAEMQVLQGAQNLGAFPTPRRLDRIEAMLNTQLAVFHRSATATRALYAVLSPDQKRTFDQVTAPPPGRGGPPQR